MCDRTYVFAASLPSIIVAIEKAYGQIYIHSGISFIRLVDFDQVTLSSLNRHASATLADVGIPKVRSVAKAIRAVSSWVEIDERQETWRMDDDGIRLLEGVDWVVGAYMKPNYIATLGSLTLFLI